MAYSKQARASALRIVAAQGYAIAAGLTGIAESTLRRWAQADAELAAKRRPTFTGFEVTNVNHDTITIRRHFA